MYVCMYASVLRVFFCLDAFKTRHASMGLLFFWRTMRSTRAFSALLSCVIMAKAATARHWFEPNNYRSFTEICFIHCVVYAVW